MGSSQDFHWFLFFSASLPIRRFSVLSYKRACVILSSLSICAYKHPEAPRSSPHDPIDINQRFRTFILAQENETKQAYNPPAGKDSPCSLGSDS
jgi:hypothetical protein